MVKLRSIQSLRALAACSVVFLHAYLVSGQPRPSEMQLGAAGVDLFFVISGFIMASVSQGRGPGKFMADRCWRIYPLWWAAAVPAVIRDGGSVTQLAADLTLWPIWGGPYTFPDPVIGWTLGFEMLFYAGVALSLRTRPALPLTYFVLASVLAQLCSSPLFSFLGNPMALEFLAGVWIARLPRESRLAAPLLVAGVAALVLTPLGPFTMHVAEQPREALLRAVMWGLPAALVVYGTLGLERHLQRPLFDVPVLLGDASYAIYVFHLTIFAARPSWLQGVPLVLTSITGGLLIHLALERRIPEFRKALRAWSENRRGGRPAPLQN